MRFFACRQKVKVGLVKARSRPLESGLLWHFVPRNDGLLRLFIPSHCSRNCSWAPATGLPLAIQLNASPAMTRSKASAGLGCFGTSVPRNNGLLSLRQNSLTFVFFHFNTCFIKHLHRKFVRISLFKYYSLNTAVYYHFCAY